MTHRWRALGIWCLLALAAGPAFSEPQACTSAPGEVLGLTILADGQTISWTPPLDTGGGAVVYDTLRSALSWDFGGSATCVEWNDGSDTLAADADVPPSGYVFHYLVRAENECGPGSTGTDSGGTPRPQARPCGPCLNDFDCDDGAFCNGDESCDVLAMTCQPGTPPSCVPYACDPAGNACFTTCTGDAECAPGYGCGGGICRKLTGSACTSDSECFSGFCTDGVCCESRCSGVCEECNLAGRAGFCDPVAAGTDPDEECAATPPSTCGTTGLCSGARSCLLHPAGTVCAAAACAGTGVSEPEDLCDGGGTCIDGGQVPCSPYTCNAATGECRTTCATSGDCVSGFQCVGGTCLKSAGQSCAAPEECASGACCNQICRDLTTDPSNCGDCGIVCQAQNGTNTCLAGSCTPICSSGWGSCDGNNNNGCETSLRTLSDCGGCGIPCDLANAAESCSTGTCTLTSCNVGYSNCDASPANGCEVSHAAPSNSCGAAEYVGSRCGDKNCGFLCGGSSWSTFAGRTGRNARWFRARAAECSDCCADIQARITLTPPPGTDYDLYVYSSCGNLIASSINGTGAVDQVILTSSDDCLAGDNGFDYWVEVRWFSGSSCSTWSLTFEGTTC